MKAPVQKPSEVIEAVVRSIAIGLVADARPVKVGIADDGIVLKITLTVAQADGGRIIGKSSRTIGYFRGVLLAICRKYDRGLSLIVIDETGSAIDPR